MKKKVGNPSGPTLTFDNYVQATQAARDGKGIMLGWRSVSAGILAEGNLTAMKEGALEFGMSYWASAVLVASPRPLVREFLDWIADEGAKFEKPGG